MKYFNGFRLLEYLVGEFTQFGLVLLAIDFFIQTVTSFSPFNLLVFVLCVLGAILCAILQMFFYLCAEARQITINHQRIMENQ